MVRTREIRTRIPVGRPSVRRPAAPPLDKDLSYYRDGLRWSFSGGRVFVDDTEVNRLISGPEIDIKTWLGVAGGLDDYRKRVATAEREKDQFLQFQSVVEALLGKISGKLKKAYDQKTSGVGWAIENGQLILNGINVRKFLALYRIKKTDKARKYLKGLKDKLALLLTNPDHEKIRGTIQGLYDEILDELSSESPAGSPRLLVARRPLAG